MVSIANTPRIEITTTTSAVNERFFKDVEASICTGSLFYAGSGWKSTVAVVFTVSRGLSNLLGSIVSSWRYITLEKDTRVTAQGLPTTSTATSRASGTPHRSLQEAFSSPNNALNSVRLFLAFLVIFGHAFPLGGFEPFTAGPFVHSGWHGTAVEGFFTISGFLILASAMRMPLFPYLWRRFLRIYPGYVVAIFVTALVFAPLGIVWGASWNTMETVRYLLKSLTLKAGDLPVEGGVPWPNTWNGSLWTLFYEALAYVGVGVFVAIPWVRRNLHIAVPILTAVLTLAWNLIPQSFIDENLPARFAVYTTNGLRLWTFFAWGMLAYTFADRIRPRTFTVALSTFALVAFLSTPALGSFGIILPPLLAYVTLAAGALLPLRLGSKNDLSYGVYVYAFPIQQLLILAGITQFGWLVTAVSCALVTVPFALASWHFVEQPALSLKSKIPARPRNVSSPAPSVPA